MSKQIVFIGPYGELRRTSNEVYDWEAFDIDCLQQGIKQLWMVVVELGDTICATAGTKVSKIKVKSIPIDDSYECFDNFSFSAPIKKVWIDGKEAEVNSKIVERKISDGGELNEISFDNC